MGKGCCVFGGLSLHPRQRRDVEAVFMMGDGVVDGSSLVQASSSQAQPQAKPSKPAQPNSNSAKRGKPFWQARQLSLTAAVRKRQLERQFLVAGRLG
jgi:hypothetical protein